MKLAAVVLLSSVISLIASDKIETLRFRPAENMTRAEIHCVQTVAKPRAVLVLCPGMNGNGIREISEDKWQEFARSQDLGLMSISFSSDAGLLEHGKGYPFAGDGSGQILLDAVRQKYGADIPLLLYGFSSGAFFTELFADWKPGRVLAWSAHATGWYGAQKYNDVPGLITCGDMDETRYGGAIVYFKQGRAQGKRLLWLSLAGLSHSTLAGQEEFVRRYFESVLRGDPNAAQWVDVDRKTIISKQDAAKAPALAGWFPDGSLLSEWTRIHTP
jgi:hypothetical protein